MNETKKRAIKMFWKLAKEKCPFQTEEIVNGYLEGFIDCAEYLLLQNTELEKENAELKDKLKNLESVAKVRLANWQKYEEENKELKEQIEKMKCWHKMDYNDKESCKKIPRGIQLLTEYDCGLFVAYCVNRWTGDHWEEHSYGITRWKEIKEK